MKASDISDASILESVVRHMQPIGAQMAKIQEDFPGFHSKVVRAKLGQLVRRGILNGCAIDGHRGDFTLAGTKSVAD